MSLRGADLARTLCLDVLDQINGAIGDEIKRSLGDLGTADRLLDVGCWDGRNTVKWAEIAGAAPAGIEVFAEPATIAEGLGVEVARIDLETTSFPWPDASFDIVVISQVLEHLKNIWLPLDEIHRVLRVGGVAILSVPNLASLHNRVLMGVGRQPTSIRVFGPHVRGFTFGEFRNLVAFRDAFEIKRSRTIGFYPLPRRPASIATRIWPAAGHSTLVVARKSKLGVGSWTAYLQGAFDDGEDAMEGSGHAGVATHYG